MNKTKTYINETQKVGERDKSDVVNNSEKQEHGNKYRTPRELSKNGKSELLIQQAQNFRGPDKEIWLDVAESLRRMLRTEKQRDDLLAEIKQRLNQMKPQIQKNHPKEIKSGVPTIIDQVKVLSEEIEKAKKEREALAAVLLKMRDERNPTTEPERHRDPSQGSISGDGRSNSNGTKRKPTSPLNQDRIKDKMVKTGKNTHLKVRVPEISKKRTESQSSQDNEDGFSSTPRPDDSENSEWELGRKERRKQPRLLKETQNRTLRAKRTAQEDLKKENVQKAKRKKKRRRKPRPPQDVVIIKPVEGKTFADILKNVNGAEIPDGGPKINKFSKTKQGSMLIKFKGSLKNASTTTEVLKKAIENTGELACLTAKTTVKIFDLNSGITIEQIQAAVIKVIPNLTEKPKVTFSYPNAREQVIAFVALPAREALGLVKMKDLQVGPFTCRIRNCEPVRKCFKCLGFGHTPHKCSGPDRTDLCYKCAQKGHKAKDCKNIEKCIACSDAGYTEEEVKHRLGTGRCKTYRMAWGKAKPNSRQ